MTAFGQNEISERTLARAKPELSCKISTQSLDSGIRATFYLAPIPDTSIVGEGKSSFEAILAIVTQFIWQRIRQRRDAKIRVFSTLMSEVLPKIYTGPLGVRSAASARRQTPEYSLAITSWKSWRS
jgi:hypothetical protein